MVAFGRRCSETLTFAARDGATLAARRPVAVPVMVVPPVAPTEMAFPAVQRFLQGWV